jgi:alkyl hydroperoxide reductase subunit F
MYDVIIIGAGAAGITAAIYAARSKLKFEIISKDFGGLTTWSPDIENYTGFHNLSGLELIEKFKEHISDYRIEVKEETITKVEKSKKEGFIVRTNSSKYETKTVIICSGSSPRKLDIPSAAKFEGKGVAYCATCDGPLFADKDVAVIGGGDSALAAALTLIQVVNKVYILNATAELTGKDAALRDNVLKSDKVIVLNNSKLLEIYGKQFVEGLKFEQMNEKKDLKVEGIFVEIGHIRNVDFVKDLIKINEKNEIAVEKNGATSMPGIYAAGDITDLPGKQTIIAAGDGARALLSAFAYLTRK